MLYGITAILQLYQKKRGLSASSRVTTSLAARISIPAAIAMHGGINSVIQVLKLWIAILDAIGLKFEYMWPVG